MACTRLRRHPPKLIPPASRTPWGSGSRLWSAGVNGKLADDTVSLWAKIVQRQTVQPQNLSDAGDDFGLTSRAANPQVPHAAVITSALARVLACQRAQEEHLAAAKC